MKMKKLHRIFYVCSFFLLNDCIGDDSAVSLESVPS